MAERPVSDQEKKFTPKERIDIFFPPHFLMPVPPETTWRLRRFMPRHGICDGKR